MEKGVVAGYQMVDVEVDALRRIVPRSGLFRSGLQDRRLNGIPGAAKKAKPVILEPIMKIQVIVPDNFMGEVTGNVSSKRGAIESIDDRPGQLKVVNAQMPLSELFGYATELRSMTQGRGSLTMEFDHYEPAPNNVTQQIIEGKKLKNINTGTCF